MSQWNADWVGVWPGNWFGGDGASPVVGKSLTIEYSITGSVHADYTFEYRIEGTIPQALIPLGGGGPDEEWIHPRVREYLKKIEDEVRAARYVPLKVEPNTPPAGSTHRELAPVQLPAVAEIDESDLEEIEDLLMLID